MESTERKKWFIKLSTNYCGTDNYILLENMTYDEACSCAYEEAKENALGYESIWWDECGYNEEDMDDELYEQLLDENSDYEVIEYDSNEHDIYL